MQPTVFARIIVTMCMDAERVVSFNYEHYTKAVVIPHVTLRFSRSSQYDEYYIGMILIPYCRLSVCLSVCL